MMLLVHSHTLISLLVNTILDVVRQKFRFLPDCKLSSNVSRKQGEYMHYNSPSLSHINILN